MPDPTNDMPSPTASDLDSRLFTAIWDTIKSWDVNVPEFYEGYCGANGSHAKLIHDAVEAVTVEALGAISADLAGKSGAWDGKAPDWFPEPPEWLVLWNAAIGRPREEESLADTEAELSGSGPV